MSFTSGKTYGEYKHKLTIQEMPNHAHKFNDCAWINGGYLSDTTHTGGNQAHNNLQPSIVTYFWKRVK